MTTNTRTSREAETRGSDTRKKTWQPPAMLDVPPAPEGYRYRWLRSESMGQEDRTNMTKKFREGYELVKPSELESSGYEMPEISSGLHKGYIGVGGLILAKFPDELADQRNAYYQQRTAEQQQAIDNDLMKQSNAAMPIDDPSGSRNSKTTFGSRNTG